MEATIIRLSSLPGKPTPGVLLFDGKPAYLTLEPPWLNNEKGKSCIPPGVYVCKRVVSRTTDGGTFIPRTYEVRDVPDRSGILFHVGNFGYDTKGCILLGTFFTGFSIQRSEKAFQEFLRDTQGEDEFRLSIHAAPPVILSS